MGTSDLHAENHGKKARGRPRTKWVPRIPALHCATTILYYTILNYYTIRLCCTTVHDVLQTLCSIRMTQKQTRMIQTLCSFSGPYYTILHDTLLYCAMLLYYTTLQCTMLYYTISYYHMLHNTMPYSTLLYSIVLYYTLLYSTDTDIHRQTSTVRTG